MLVLSQPDGRANVGRSASIYIDVLTNMRRLGLALVGVAFLANAGLVAAAPLARTSAGGPKVVIIVGPAGAATAYYRQLADETANAAAKLTSNVVRVYSPNATWERVKAELQGASIVVYLGHGNGWPSRYHSALFPSTEDGFGLNPNAGAADAHQYFGETRIAAEIKLAKNAVVVFSHLCYASGNTEPGLPEGTLDQAQRRVDNYAAGFFAAGSRCGDRGRLPRAEVLRDFRAEGPEERQHDLANGAEPDDRFLAFNSVRTKGAIAEMDPDQTSSGFHRSMVIRSGLTSDQVIGGSIGRPVDVTPRRSRRSSGSASRSGRRVSRPRRPRSASTTLVLPVAKGSGRPAPSTLMIETRWDRLDHPAGRSDRMPPATRPVPWRRVVAGAPRSRTAQSGREPARAASGAPSASSTPATPADDPADDRGRRAEPAHPGQPEIPGEVVAPQASHLRRAASPCRSMCRPNRACIGSSPRSTAPTGSRTTRPRRPSFRRWSSASPARRPRPGPCNRPRRARPANRSRCR